MDGEALAGGTAAPSKPLSKRGEKTKNRLKLAARECLNELGIGSVRIVDVAERAGVAAGLFYRYFPDLPTLLTEVLTGWGIEVFADLPDPGETDPFSATRLTFLGLAQRIDREPGLLAAMVEGARRFPMASEAWRAGIDRLLRRQMKPLNEAFPGNAFGVEHLVASLVGLVEGYFIARYVRGDALAADAAGSPEEAAELLALIWHRAAYLANPREDLIETYRRVAKVAA